MIAIGTRYWNEKENSSPDKIRAFVDKASEITDLVIVAVNVAKDKSNTIEALTKEKNDRLVIVPVQPWGFASAMNALVYEARIRSQKFLLSQSVEVRLEKENLKNMMAEMDDNTLCVGTRMEGHDFHSAEISEEVEVKANGCTIPWNTCKILNLKHYQVFGFPLITDAPYDPSQAGVEELCADSLAQHMLSKPENRLKIKMIEIEGMKWETDFGGDPERQKAHERKMRLKIERPETQLALTKLPPATVIHIRKKV